MTVMGERLPEAWMVEWHRNSRVEFPLRRWSFLQFPGFLLVGYSALTLGRLPDMLDDGGWRFLAYLLIATYVGIVAMFAWQFVTQRPILVVDHRGIHQGRRRFMPWTEIGSIGPVSGPKLARQLHVYPKNIWAKHLILTQQHVNDLQTFQTWLQEVLDEQRRTESPRDDNDSDRRRTH
ncbi:hypothetical protein EV137_5381 [Kribbella pratensis]|uniref:PH domain-containing protein n=1 Tax=Kribbella pratensis TaxID=2512112 RepID=A0ABY2FA96_9ACTN|nr:hypothetical protein [Kribbella pratensis]TDW87308.1 hypothetical protein EV137_5381 [Kribbella pratensis]